MLLHQLPFAWNYLGAQLRIRFGLVPQSVHVDARSELLPATRFAVSAVGMCRGQPAYIVEHSFRTWYIGKILARLDGCTLDDELFFCAALLHDWGLTAPSSTHDFTRASADAAADCAASNGVAPARIQLLKDGICRHASIGISATEDPIAYYVQCGAMSDIVGIQRWRAGHDNLEQIRCWHPYGPDYRSSLVRLTQQEAAAFPCGRFAFYMKWHLAGLIDMAPLYP